MLKKNDEKLGKLHLIWYHIGCLLLCYFLRISINTLGDHTE